MWMVVDCVDGGRWKGVVTVHGQDERGLLYGVGRLLRKMNMTLVENYYTRRVAKVTIEAGLSITSSSDKPMRGLQLGYVHPHGLCSTTIPCRIALRMRVLYYNLSSSSTLGLGLYVSLATSLATSLCSDCIATMYAAIPRAAFNSSAFLVACLFFSAQCMYTDVFYPTTRTQFLQYHRLMIVLCVPRLSLFSLVEKRYRPKTNSYDGLTPSLFEDYVIDLATFGANQVELVK